VVGVDDTCTGLSFCIGVLESECHCGVDESYGVMRIMGTYKTHRPHKTYKAYGTYGLALREERNQVRLSHSPHNGI